MDAATFVTNFIQKIPASKKILAFHYILSVLLYITFHTNLTVTQIAQNIFSFLEINSLSSLCEKINSLFSDESVLKTIALPIAAVFSFILLYGLVKELLPSAFIRKSDSNTAAVILMVIFTILPRGSYSTIIGNIFSITGAALYLIFCALIYIAFSIFMLTRRNKKYIAEKYKTMGLIKYFLYTLIVIPIQTIATVLIGYSYIFIHTTSQILIRPLHISLISQED